MTTQVGVIEPFGSWVSTTLSRRVATLARTMPQRPAVPIASRLAFGLILAVIASSPSAQTGTAPAPDATESTQGARFDVLEFEVDGHPAVNCVKDPALSHRELPVILSCRSGARSALAAAALKDLGFAEPVSLAGGFMGWANAGQPVER